MSWFIMLLVMINPFSQVLYLTDLMKSLSRRDFLEVHIKASLLSFGVFVVFMLAGDFVLTQIFHVRLAALQIFGGIIMMYVAYRYLSEGEGANLMYQGEISELAPRISLPYMVGPGTIWVSITIGQELDLITGVLIILGVLTANSLFVIIIKCVYTELERYKKTMLGKYFGILMRTNALFIGAIAVEMIIRGLYTAFPMLAPENLPSLP